MVESFSNPNQGDGSLPLPRRHQKRFVDFHLCRRRRTRGHPLRHWHHAQGVEDYYREGEEVLTKNLTIAVRFFGGRWGIRTLDLLDVNESLKKNLTAIVR